LAAGAVLCVNGLSPNRPAEIDLASIGERSGAGTDSAADRCALEGSTDHQSAECADAGADSAAAKGAVASGVAAGDGHQQRKQ